jgi:hypothetical protein
MAGAGERAAVVLRSQLLDLGACDGPPLDAWLAAAHAKLSAALPWFAGLGAERQAVLLCIGFEAGVAWVLRFHDLLGRARDERFEDAAETIRRSVWAHQHPMMAARLAAQMASGAWQ